MGAMHSPEYYTLRKTIATLAIDTAHYRLGTYVAGLPAERSSLERINELSHIFDSQGVQAFCDASNDVLKITFGLGLYGAGLKKLVSKTLQLPEEGIVENMIRDFAREYLNQVVGSTKKLINSQGVELSLGIPDAYLKELELSPLHKGLEFVEGFKVEVEGVTFEVKVTAALLKQEALAGIKPQNVKEFFEAKTAEVDIDALFDAL